MQSLLALRMRAIASSKEMARPENNLQPLLMSMLQQMAGLSERSATSSNDN
jgi:hypothetical protein